MDFKLPEVHEIDVDVDGRRHAGAWSVVLNDLVVYYNGYTSSTPVPEVNPAELAIGLLADLVREHYLPQTAIAAEVPEGIRSAAHGYVNNLDGEDSSQALVGSFGASTAGSLVHRRLSWLCVNALQPLVPCWKSMCDGDEPERTAAELRRWLEDSAHPVDWESACEPQVALRDGEVVRDCDACRLEPIAAAVASTANFLRTADPASAVTALDSAAAAYAEGCHPEDTPDRFEKWLVLEVLPNACACRAIEG